MLVALASACPATLAFAQEHATQRRPPGPPALRVHVRACPELDAALDELNGAPVSVDLPPHAFSRCRCGDEGPLVSQTDSPVQREFRLGQASSDVQHAGPGGSVEGAGGHE